MTREAEKKIVWPMLIDSKKAKVIPEAEKFLSEGDFANAREVIWRASTTGIEPVDAAIREFGYEFLNTKVNPQEWKLVEKNMRDKALEFSHRIPSS